MEVQTQTQMDYFRSNQTCTSHMPDSDLKMGQDSPTTLHQKCEEIPIIPSACFTSSSPAAIDPIAGKLTESNVNSSLSRQSDSNAVVKLQKVYRSYRTRRILADSAVVAEELCTISFFNLEPETVASRWNRICLNASKVGKGLSKDSKAQKLAFQHWIEAIDPRHRYGHNLHLYYKVWCETDAGQPFFYWLDIGDGKELDLKDCPRSKLKIQCIKYLGPQERAQYEYMVVEGKIIHKQTGDLLDTKKGSQAAKWLFVMSTTKKLYAGESICAYSGHYRPTDDRLDIFLSFLKENGVTLDEVQIGEDSDGCDESKFGAVGITSEVQTSEVEIPEEEKKMSSSGSTKPPQAESKNKYKRTLSGGLQSPRAQVPKSKILQRINSKEAAKSFQLGHQLSLKWTTGAGPRIGCIADYPEEVRAQALEFLNLSPRKPPCFRQTNGLASPTSYSTTGMNNGGINCNAG